ncbi:pneumococcal-type histidine triad protein [Kitasatospora sp. DSM 101779]|uniref:pneumococcal-type histidine triad protein n=1 Tax=Kitasatospora sp. DSM 101779 TaxID=2853165 RepID=UPI0021D88496|nr:pneumococcal-type histidine triad protein [Kitasatospora sp. DSM 101779]MCU7827337.1 pneumococcal-type histidine triad protein [Kitasatospora sp. DSM 101779]
MPKSDLTPEEIAAVRAYVEIAPGVAMDRLDVRQARLAKAVGGWFRKPGPGLYEIVTTTPRPGTQQPEADLP